MSENWKDQVADGLANYQELAQDGDVGKLGAQVVGILAKAVAAEIGPSDVCALAVPTVVALPDVRATMALVVILQDRLLAVYQTGTFRKKTFVERIPRAAITEVSWGAGTAPGTLGATMLTVAHRSGTIQIALPRQRTQLVATALKSALSAGTFGIAD